MDNRQALIKDVIDRFDFAKVHVVMTAVDWRWQTTAGDGYEVPTITRLKAMATYLLNETIKSGQVTGSGGLEASYHPKVDDEDECVELKFIFESKDSAWWNDD